MRTGGGGAVRRAYGVPGTRRPGPASLPAVLLAVLVGLVTCGALLGSSVLGGESLRVPGGPVLAAGAEPAHGPGCSGEPHAESADHGEPYAEGAEPGELHGESADPGELHREGVEPGEPQADNAGQGGPREDVADPGEPHAHNADPGELHAESAEPGGPHADNTGQGGPHAHNADPALSAAAVRALRDTFGERHAPPVSAPGASHGTALDPLRPGRSLVPAAGPAASERPVRRHGVRAPPSPSGT